MKKYLLGLFKNLFHRGVSIFTLVDNKSKISSFAKVYSKCKIYNSTIDSYSYIGCRSDIICADIGKFCSIAPNCVIGIATHSINYISTSPIFTSKKNGTGYSWIDHNEIDEFKRVTIGNDVWIGINVIVMGGVKIDNGAIIGAGSIVTKDIPAYAIAVGSPAKVIKYRFNKLIIDKLLLIKWWNKNVEEIKEKIEYFQIDEFSLNDLDEL